MADPSKTEKEKPDTPEEAKAKAEAAAAKAIEDKARYDAYYKTAIRNGDIQPEKSKSFAGSVQEGFSSFGQFLDLFFTMIFSPEDLEIKKIMYGWDIEVPKKWKQPWEKAVATKEDSLHPDRNKTVAQFFEDKFNKELLTKNTLLRPDLLQEMERDPKLQEFLKEIIESCHAQNSNSAYPVDPYLVANQLFELNQLNKDGMANLDKTLQSIAKNSALYGGQPLAIIAMGLGDDPINWIARNLDPPVAPQNLKIGQLMEGMKAYNEEHATNLSLNDSVSKAGELTKISQSIVYNSSVYWKDIQRAESQAKMIKLGIAITAPKQKTSQTFKDAATPKPTEKEPKETPQLKKICDNGKEICGPTEGTEKSTLAPETTIENTLISP